MQSTRPLSSSYHLLTLNNSDGLVALPAMVVIDFIPELLTVGTAASSVVGVYFDRLRKKIEREEPEDIERAANEAVAEAQLEPIAHVPPPANADGSVTVSQTELQGLLENAVGAAVAGIKSELATERMKDRRAGFRSNLAFFITGILASAAITLYVHPINSP
jgi:hypothetical protein